MFDLKNRLIDEYGNVVIKNDYITDVLMQGIMPQDITVEYSKDIERFQEICQMFSYEDIRMKIYNKPTEKPADFFNHYNKNFFTPKKYQQLDIKNYILNLCLTEDETKRVNEEFKIFEKYELLDVLRYLVYLIETFKENNILWGVGRGSSVSSYILYLIGVHKINSLKYNLSFDEFLS